MELLSLTRQEFDRFAKLVYERTGIYLAPEKLGLLSNRLRKRLKALGLSSFEDYYRLMSDRAASDAELPFFLSAVTTNETYFFRNARLWEVVCQQVIPSVIAGKTRPPRSFRVWSAAASSGEEAYTCAIVLREQLPQFPDWIVSIVGTDISNSVLDKARGAVYGDYAVAKMSPERIRRWFEVSGENYRVCDELRKLVQFKFHNLRDSFQKQAYDLVMLRNVLMYFDTPMKRRAIEVAAEAVAPGGYLFIGDVDPVRTSSDLTGCLTLKALGPGLYHRPFAPAENAGPTARSGA